MSTTTNSLGIDVEALRELLPTLDDEGKRRLLSKINVLTKDKRGTPAAQVAAQKAPKTDDELHAWIVRETGFNIPRVAVCVDHQAPFDFVADAYFEREDALFQVGSRELGKTLGVSVVHYANAETRPGCTSCTFGAIESQAERAYDHVKSFVYTKDANGMKILKPQMAGEPLRKKTEWKTGSKIEILIGSKSGVNSPHPHKVHADEVNLMDKEVFDQSRNMSSSSVVDGERIGAQDFGTSTLKSNHGLVASILSECADAEEKGFAAPWKIYRSCIFEAAQEVPNCQCAPEAERQARLTELGMDPNDLCVCDRIVKGEWAEDNPRTLVTVCKGKFFRSRGWMDHSDVKRKFVQNTRTTWDAEMECRRASADGLYLEGWARERYCVKGWAPRPELGPVFMGVDWGGGAESAILWVQTLRVPVQIAGVGEMVTVPVGAHVVFDEFLKAGIGATKLADEVCAREVYWRRRVPGFRVAARFADMAGRQQRDDWREHTPALRTVWWLSSRDFDPQVTCLQGLVEDKHYWVDVERCSRHCDDIESWRQKNGREVHDESSHCLVAGTMIETACGAVPIERVRAGDRVYTRKGLRTVSRSGVSCSRPQTVYRVVLSDGSSIIATSKHLVASASGWTSVAALRYGDTISLWLSEIPSERRSSTAASRSIDIPIAIDSAISAITRATSTGARTIFTASCGMTPMGKSPKVSTSITRMRIGTTMSYRILSVSRRWLMDAFIISANSVHARYTRQSSERKCHVLNASQSSGIATKEKLSVVRRVRLGMLLKPLLISFAKRVEIDTRPRMPNLAFVLTSVSLSGVGILASTTKSEYAQVAESHSSSTNTHVHNDVLIRVLRECAQWSCIKRHARSAISVLKRPVPRRDAVHSDAQPYVVSVSKMHEPQWVYDLTVDGEHEFYANGILVHNSMAASRYINSNVVARELRRGNREQSRAVDPVVVQRGEAAAPSAVAHASDGFDGERRWREQVGQYFPDRSPGPWRR